jgi:hypothetical protein
MYEMRKRTDEREDARNATMMGWPGGNIATNSAQATFAFDDTNGMTRHHRSGHLPVFFL